MFSNMLDSTFLSFKLPALAKGDWFSEIEQKMYCSGENEILRGIFHVVSLHFVLYLGNLDYFLDNEWTRFFRYCGSLILVTHCFRIKCFQMDLYFYIFRGMRHRIALHISVSTTSLSRGGGGGCTLYSTYSEIFCWLHEWWKYSATMW